MSDAKWQVGKRYRFKNKGILTFVVLFVAPNGDAFTSCWDGEKFDSHTALYSAEYFNMEIVPPGPRTGKGFLIKGLQNKTPYNAFFDVRPAAPVNGEVIEIEWKEIV